MSPRASTNDLASFSTPPHGGGGSSRKLDLERVQGLRLELGAGEGVTALLERSATAGEGGRVRAQARHGAAWLP